MLRRRGQRLRSKVSAQGATWLIEARFVDRLVALAADVQAAADFTRDLESGLLHLGALPSRHDVRELRVELERLELRIERLEGVTARLERALSAARNERGSSGQDGALQTR